MANLYFTNASGDRLWNNLSNWNTAADGSGNSPTSIPWVDGYFDYDLYSSQYFAEFEYSYGYVIIPSNVTGTCNFEVILPAGGEINGGNFLGNILIANNAFIIGGVFSGNIILADGGSISGGDLSGITLLSGYGVSIPVYGVSINIDADISDAVFQYETITAYQNGVPYTGEWRGQAWLDGVWQGIVTPKLYYTNASGTARWGNLADWNTAADGSGSNPTNIPWIDGYFDYDLVNVSGLNGFNQVINTLDYSSFYSFSSQITGTCDIPIIFAGAEVNGGTFTGQFSLGSGGIINTGVFNGPLNIIGEGGETINGGVFNGQVTNNGTINDGIFYGTVMNDEGLGTGTITGGTFNGVVTNNGTITGGTFTADNSINYNGIINGGTFSGGSFINGASINGGTFTGNDFYTNGSISGGTFTGTGFWIQSNTIFSGNFNINGFVNESISILYENITINVNGLPYTGDWQGQAWLDGVWQGVVTPKLYYTNAAGGEFFYPSEWSNVLNWNTEPDGSGDTPTGIPWVDGYFDYDLRYGDSYGGKVYWATPANVGISSTTGSCYLDVHMRDFCTINGGNWYGTFTNQGQIVSGNFYGVSSNRNNNAEFDSYGNIYGGTFYADNFFNDAKIYGGEFLGSNFTNEENGWGTVLFGGEYNINGFTNVGGSIDYPNITISENGTPYSGSWQGQIWSAGAWVSVELLPTVLYYTNASGDGLWSTLQNWNTSADGLGESINSIPWITSATSSINLYLAYPNLPAPILNGLLLGGNGQDFSIRATCDQKIAQEIIDNGYDIVAQAVL